MDIEKILTEYDAMFGKYELSEIEAFLQKNIEQAGNTGDYGSVITLLNEIIGFCRDTTQREKALHYCTTLMDLMNRLQLNGRVEYATSLLNIANAYRAFGLCKESVALYEEVYENYKINVPSDDFAYASLYNNWSLVYQEMEDYEKAKELLLKALVIADQYEEAVIPQANTRTNLAVTLLQLHTEEDYKAAMCYLQEALEVFERDGGKDFHYGAALVAMGDAYFSKQEYGKASEYYEKGMTEIEKHVGRTDNYNRVLEKYQFSINQIDKENALESMIEQKSAWKGNLKNSREFYEQYGKSMLHEHFPEYENRIAIGLVGEGSDCFGFDDEISTDHDYEVGFCMWLTDDDYQKIGVALQQQYEALIAQHSKQNVHNPFLNQRRGVFAIADFCNRILGVNFACDIENFVKEGENNLLKYVSGDFGKYASADREQNYSKPVIDYLVVPEENLATLTNGEVFRDDLGIFTSIRKYLQNYYPENVWRLRLAQKIHEFSQYAQSNYPRMMARQDYITAGICIGKAVESAMDISYLLNRTYAPYYKWKKKGLEKLNKLQDILPILEKIAGIQNQASAWENIIYDSAKVNQNDQIVCLFEQIAERILEELQKQDIIYCLQSRRKNDTFLEQYCQEIGKGKHMDIVEQIVELEWKQFDKVKNEGGRADCQNDFKTFSIMRKSQYLTWNQELLNSYYNDLVAADNKGWNLIMEKYARMMKSTAPDRYAELEKDIPALNEQRIAIQEEIIRIQVAWMEEFAKDFPKMAGNARSIHTAEDNAYNTSYETYLRGEIGTYSESTFVLYGRFITKLMQSGKNLAYETMNHTAKLYGYESVEDAERRLED